MPEYHFTFIRGNFYIFKWGGLPTGIIRYDMPGFQAGVEVK